MNKTRLLILSPLAVFAISASTAFAEETVGEKAKSTMHDAKRATKKGYHRAKEAVCMKGDVACAEQKLKHRALEGKDAVKDGASEIKNKVD